VRLLLTVLRDKNVDVSSFADTLHRLAALLLMSFFDRVEVRERNVSTGAGSLYTGTECTPVTSIALTDIGQELMDSAFHPFRPVCKRQIGTYVPAAGASTAAATAGGAGGDKSAADPAAGGFWSSVTLPPNVSDSNVLVFFPILTLEEAPAMLAVLDDLLGAAANRGVGAGQVTLLCVLVARPVLWAAARRYPDLLIVAAAVDELTPQGRLVPGISAWEDRYRAAR